MTFTATVTSSGSPVTDGTVTFLDQTPAPRSPPTSPSTARARPPPARRRSPRAPTSIRATFNGTSGFLTSTGTVEQIVDTPTTTSGDRHVVQHRADHGSRPGPGDAVPVADHREWRRAVRPRVTVQLGGVSHQVPFDLDVLLVGPAGQNIVLMSDVGGNANTTNVTLTFADSAEAAIPAGGPLTSGTFHAQ